jgi:hypothetical protein
MKILFTALFMSLSLVACTPQQIQQVTGAIFGSGGITQGEASGGMKQALQIGLVTATGLLSKEDGYYGNSLVRIPWPEEAQFVMNAMTTLGMQDKVDNVTRSLNRAAEKAAEEALDVFLESLTQMTLQDAIAIVKDGHGAGTAYFKRTTTDILTERFRPIIENSLGEVNATNIWANTINIYNNLPIPGKKPVDTDLTAFVTAKAMDGLFLMVEKKENEIRDKVSERSSDLLQKVFGYADQFQNPN